MPNQIAPPTINIYLLCAAQVQLPTSIPAPTARPHSPTNSAQSIKKNERFMGRLLLRGLVQHLTQLPPASIQIQDQPNKPPLVPALNDQAIFSISHSAGLVAIALAKTDTIRQMPPPALGLDIEQHRLRRNLQISELICSANERADIAKQATREEKFQTFYDQWTRKEAALKSKHLGIFSQDLRQLAFTRMESGAPCNVFTTNISLDKNTSSITPTEQYLEQQHAETNVQRFSLSLFAQPALTPAHIKLHQAHLLYSPEICSPGKVMKNPEKCQHEHFSKKALAESKITLKTVRVSPQWRCYTSAD